MALLASFLLLTAAALVLEPPPSISELNDAVSQLQQRVKWISCLFLVRLASKTDQMSVVLTHSKFPAASTALFVKANMLEYCVDRITANLAEKYVTFDTQYTEEEEKLMQDVSVMRFDRGIFENSEFDISLTKSQRGLLDLMEKVGSR